MNHWLFKSEPASFSIDALAKAPKRTACWDGVRNYQARNLLRDSIAMGDLGFFYHSGIAQPGIAGIVRITKPGYPDASAFRSGDDHFDPGSHRDTPRWFAIDVRLERKLKRLITLDELRAHAELRDLVLLRRGNRLSVMPITKREWDFIIALE